MIFRTAALSGWLTRSFVCLFVCDWKTWILQMQNQFSNDLFYALLEAEIKYAVEIRRYIDIFLH